MSVGFGPCVIRVSDWRLTQDIFVTFQREKSVDLVVSSLPSWLCNFVFCYDFRNFLSLLDKKLKCVLSSEYLICCHFFLALLLAEIKSVIFMGKKCIEELQGAIQNFEYVSNCAFSSGAICLKILPFDCLSVCHVVFFL